MLVVNLFGAPSSGKSTLASELFAQLKREGYNVELVTEFAKDLTWKGNWDALADQLYVLGQQEWRLYRLVGHVDIAITDNPLLLSIIYNDSSSLGKEFNDMIIRRFNAYRNVNFFLSRDWEYKMDGRKEDEELSNKIEQEILDVFCKYGIPYIQLERNEILGRIKDIFDKEHGYE